nr:reverse transcriptase domain-containing protein [Tanacetum cinerariifolium]
MVPATTSLTGFSGETIWPLRQLRLLLTIGDSDHSTRAWMNFMIVRSLSPCNGIIGRPEIKEIQAVPSTAHRMLKFPADGGIVTIRSTILIPAECATVITSPEVPKEAGVRHENFKVALHPNFPDQEVAIGGTLSAKGRTKLCSLLKENLDIFTWQPSYMTGVPRSVAEHRLNIREGYSPVRKKKRGQALERAKAIQAEVQKLVEAGIVREVYYHEWLSNPVMKSNGKLNLSATTLSSVSWTLTKAITRYSWQSQMKRKRLSTPAKGVLLYKNAFRPQERWRHGHTEAEMLRDIGETFRTLRKINMKLHPKKCTFWAVEEMFLGYMITPKGIKPCPNKTKAVLQIPSPRIIKEVHSLNEKLASLNRFLSKSAEKSLPIFKTLKKCIKKSDFHWMSEAKQAFKQLKQHLSELPLLVAPKPKEELIVYLSASYRAISAVLMTERGTVQMPVYFVSHLLQGPELSYTPMEKLVLSLVFAAKRLRSMTITKIERHAGRRQYHVPTKDVGERTGPSGFPSRNAERKSARRISSRNSTRAVDTLHGWIVMCGWKYSKKNLYKKKEVTTVVEEDGPTWMTPIMEYLKEGTLSSDRKEARKLRIKSRQYELLEGVLYRRSFLTSWLRCVGPLQAEYVIREIHEGSCSMYAGPRSMVAKAIRLGYYWPTIDRDARDMIPGPFPEGLGKVKFLIVAMDYFTKWIEAKAMATITGSQSCVLPREDSANFKTWLRFVSRRCFVLSRRRHVFCLKISAFCLKTKLRFASRPSAFCLKISAFCLKTKLHFASRPSAFVSRSLRFVSRPSCVLPQDLLCFVSRLTAFCFQRIAFCLQAHCVLHPTTMLDRTDFASWQQRIRLYCRGKENGLNILKSIDEGSYRMGTVRETFAESTEGTSQFSPERPRVYSDLTLEEKDRYNANIRATNILLQGLPKDIYTLINHYTDAKDIWDNVKMLLEGSELTKEDQELQLYDDFKHFQQHKEESIHSYYVRFAKLINDMRNIKLTMSRLQLNSKFVNNMLPEWGRFVTAVKLNRGLRDSNYDQLGQGMNPQGGNATGYGGAQTRVGNVNPGQARSGQARPVKCYNYNGTWHIAWNCTQPKRPQNSEYYKDKMLLMQAHENGVALDAEQLLFLAGGQDNAFDDDAPTAQTMFMANLSSADPITDEAGPSYDLDILSEVHDHDHYQDTDCAHHEEHMMHDSVQPDHVVDSHADYTSDSYMILYDQYVKDNEPALYNGHEIIKDNHAPDIVHNTEDTLEIAEITRKKIAKMNDPECVTRKVNISPHDYSKKNFLATFTPQKQLTPEQTFWSNDLIKLKSKALKERSKVSRPIKALTVYPQNTPKTLVPKVLPTKSQVKIHIFTLIQLFLKFDKTCKKRITPTGLTEGERGFEQTKECYLKEVIPFFKTLKDNFKGIQKALIKEIKEMNDVFEELEAEVSQYAVDRKHDAIERKKLLIANDNLIAECLSQEVFSVAINSELNVAQFTEMHVANTTVEARCLALEAELANLHSIGNNPPTPDKDTPDFDSVFVIGKMQASLQGKDNVIRQLEKQLSQLQVTHSDTDSTLTVQTADSQITKLTKKVTNLQVQNNSFRAENDKIKQHYKELYDFIKITRAKHIEQVTALTTKNVKLKAQTLEKVNSVSKDHVKPNVLARGKHAIDVEPIVPRLRNNKDAHLDYLRHLKESVETIRDIVEEAKVALNNDLNNLLTILSLRRSKLLLPNHLIRVNSCPNASRSQPKSNVNPNRISPAKVVNKLPVEDQPRTNMSHLRTSNRVDSSSRLKPTVVQIVLWYLDSGCSKHMTGDRSRLMNFVKKFIGTVRFGNDHFGAIMGYKDYVIGGSVIFRVYYVE